MEYISTLDRYFFLLNNNSYFIGIMMVILNIGTKYLMQEFGETINYIFNIKFIRRIMLFTVFFVATRDIKVSIILTGIFIIITMELLHEKSRNCIIPKEWLNKLNKPKLDINNQQINEALQILKKAGMIK